MIRASCEGSGALYDQVHLPGRKAPGVNWAAAWLQRRHIRLPAVAGFAHQEDPGDHHAVDLFGDDLPVHVSREPAEGAFRIRHGILGRVVGDRRDFHDRHGSRWLTASRPCCR